MYKIKQNLSKSAFSLVELMVTLIVVSCIVACLAPVITKKLGNSVKVGASQLAELTNKCDEFGEKCKLCYKGKKCVMCEIACADGEFRDNEKCVCRTCSDISEGCLECSENACKKCDKGYGLDPDTKMCTPCLAGSYSKEASNSACAKCPVDNFCTGGEYIEKCALDKGAYEGSIECSACPSNCSNCEVPNVCLKCADGFYLDEGVCTPCPSGYRCDGVDKFICSAGQYSSDDSLACLACGIGKGSIAGSSTCFDCSNGCAKCSSTSVCTGCKTGFRLKDKACERVVNEGCGEHCKPGKCSSASNTCSECDGVSYRNNTGGCSPRCKLNPDPDSYCPSACAEKGSTYTGKFRLRDWSSENNTFIEYTDMFFTKEKCESLKNPSNASHNTVLACVCANGSSVYSACVPEYDSDANDRCPDNCLECKNTGSGIYGRTCMDCAENYFPIDYSCFKCRGAQQSNCASESSINGCCERCTSSSVLVTLSSGYTYCLSRCLVKGDSINTNSGLNKLGTNAYCDEFCKNKGYIGSQKQGNLNSVYDCVESANCLSSAEKIIRQSDCNWEGVKNHQSAYFKCICKKADGGTFRYSTSSSSSVDNFDSAAKKPEFIWYTGS